MDATKKKQLITWGIIIVIVLTIIYFVFFNKKKEVIDPVTGLAAPAVFPLKKGSKGKEVEQLQMYLLKEYGAQFPMFGIDGAWGDETGANVQKFLKKDNVSKDSYDKWNLASFKTTTYK